MTENSNLSHRENPAGSLTAEFFRRIGRFGASLIVLVSLAVLGWSCAISFSEAFEAFPAFSNGVAFTSVLGLGAFLISQLEKLRDLFDHLWTWIKSSSAASESKLWRNMGKLSFETAAIAFTVSLATITSLDGRGQGCDAVLTTPEQIPDIQFVHGILYPAPDNSLAVYLPYLVFKQGGLQEPSRPLVESDQEPPGDLFHQHSFSISPGQGKKLWAYLRNLVAKCQATDISPVSIEILGFASDAPFVDGQDRPRGDSKLLNRHLANLRAESVYTYIATSSLGREAVRSSIQIKPRTWGDFREMKNFRDRNAFQSFQFSLSEYTDHRSAVLRVNNPSRCTDLFPSGGLEFVRTGRSQN